MTFAGIMIGFLVAYFLGWPKSFGRHCADFMKAYRAAMK